MSKTFYNAKNLRLKNGFARNPDRYYLEEYFEQLPVRISPQISGYATSLPIKNYLASLFLSNAL